MGVEDEFSEFVVHRWGALVRAAILLGCSPVEAEDVVQSALARCLTSWSRVRRAADRDAYVHRVLVNTFVDTRRPKSSRELPLAEPPADRALDPAPEVRIDVERSLGRLPFDQRVVVVLRYYADLSEHQMTAVLEVPPGTVKSRLARALQALAADPGLQQEVEESR